MEKAREKVYYELDSVLADFERGVVELCHAQPQDPNAASPQGDDAMWAAIRDTAHFYNRLELMPGARELFDFVYGLLGDDCQILSGIPKAKRGISTAGEDKIQWAHRMLSPDVTVNIVYKEQKKDFCTGKNCVLVDDLVANIDAWETYGGTGILHQNAETSLKRLREILSDAAVE